jgi:hypothetical protein
MLHGIKHEVPDVVNEPIIIILPLIKFFYPFP